MAKRLLDLRNIKIYYGYWAVTGRPPRAIRLWQIITHILRRLLKWRS